MAQTSAKAVSPPTHRRRVLRVLGAAGASLCLLLVASLAALHTPPARRFVLSLVTQVLAAQRIELRADELSYNLLDLSATLRNVRVRAMVMFDSLLDILVYTSDHQASQATLRPVLACAGISAIASS